MYVIFPFHMVEKGARVILYGGGLAGKNYLAQMWETHYCEVIAICDKNYRSLNIKDVPLISIEEVGSYSYDYIVITPVESQTRQDIQKKLVEIGVDEKRIISDGLPPFEWDAPKVEYKKQCDEYESRKELANYIGELNPKLLISSRRIDIVVRTLLFRDFMTGIENRQNLSLYSRYVFCRTGGHEVSRYHSDEGKSSVSEFVEKGKKLCESIKKDGFHRKNFIPVEKENRPCDGLHRIAAAIVAGEKIWVRHYPDKIAIDCNLKWFEENGFSVNDRIRILREFCELYPGELAMLVLYAPYKDLWDYMESQANTAFTVVGGITIDFSDHYITFDNYIRGMYSDENRWNEYLQRKTELLSLAPLQFRLLLLSDERKNNDDFYQAVHCFKKQMRKCLHYDINSVVPAQIHSTDSREEFEHLKRMFLSANQITWEKRRVCMYYRKAFLTMLGQLKAWCRQNDISLNQVCVVGSAVLELYGLRNANNLNIVVSDISYVEDRQNEDNIELMRENYFEDEDGGKIPTDVVIMRDEYHTVFSDIKFCNMDFVYRWKKKRGTQKDIIDCSKIEQFYRYHTNLEDKEYFHQQVKVELMKRGIRDYEFY